LLAVLRPAVKAGKGMEIVLLWVAIVEVQVSQPVVAAAAMLDWLLSLLGQEGMASHHQAEVAMGARLSCLPALVQQAGMGVR